MSGAPVIASAPPPPTAPGGGSMTEFLLYLGLAMVAIIGAGVGIMLYRRRVLAEDAGGARARMLEQLRSMRDRGELTPEEFDAARRAAISPSVGRPGEKARKPGTGNTASPTPRAKPAAESGPRVAQPGFDLTGAPLPRPRDETSSG